MKVAQLCPTLCNPMEYTYSPWNSLGQNTGVGSLFLLQGIFPTQWSHPGLPHCRWILYQLSHKGSPRILEWVAYPFSGDLANPGIKLRSPALQANSLLTELSGKPNLPVLLAFKLYSSLVFIINYHEPWSGFCLGFLVCDYPATCWLSFMNVSLYVSYLGKFQPQLLKYFAACLLPFLPIS